MVKPIFLGIDLGGTSIKMGIVDEHGRLIHHLSVPTPVKEGYLKIIETFEHTVDVLLSESGYTKQQIKAAGVGVPGFVLAENGVVSEAVNLGWKDVPLREILMLRWGIPVVVENDANAAAIGEMWAGAGRGAQHILCLTIGTGIGAGIIINREIYHGYNGMAGEIGHFTLKESRGRACNCGKKGCLETEASATAIVQDALEQVEQIASHRLRTELESSGTLSARFVIELAQEQNEVCQQIIGSAASKLGAALAEICIILNPEVLIIGGGVSYAGDLLFQPLQHSFQQSSLPRIAQSIRICQAELGNHAGMIGTAYLAKQEGLKKEVFEK